eukprot:352507-Chlamydomonas_euryale.AAC.13
MPSHAEPRMQQPEMMATRSQLLFERVKQPVRHSWERQERGSRRNLLRVKCRAVGRALRKVEAASAGRSSARRLACGVVAVAAAGRRRSGTSPPPSAGAVVPKHCVGPPPQRRGSTGTVQEPALEPEETVLILETLRRGAGVTRTPAPSPSRVLRQGKRSLTRRRERVRNSYPTAAAVVGRRSIAPSHGRAELMLPTCRRSGDGGTKTKLFRRG